MGWNFNPFDIAGFMDFMTGDTVAPVERTTQLANYGEIRGQEFEMQGLLSDDGIITQQGYDWMATHDQVPPRPLNSDQVPLTRFKEDIPLLLKLQHPEWDFGDLYTQADFDKQAASVPASPFHWNWLIAGTIIALGGIVALQVVAK